MARPGGLPGANLDGAVLCDARWGGSRFGRADLRGCDLRDAAVGHVELRDATYDVTTVCPRTFDPAAAGMVEVHA